MTLSARLRQLSQGQWLRLYGLLAFVIACKIMWNQHGWVNNDSLLYFEQARLLAAGELPQATALFSWIFYPALLALIHRLTTLDIHTAAVCLNVLCFVLFVAGFQQLLLEAGAKLRTLHWGMWLLFSTQYIVGDVLGMLLRDEGFWAAFTWALVYWLRGLKSGRWQAMLAFQGSMLIAILFRIEASGYLLALPLCALLMPGLSWRQRNQRWLRANVLTLLGVTVIAAAWLTGALQVEHLGRLQEVVTQVTRLFTERIDFINQKADIISRQVLGEDLDQYGVFSLWASLILIAAFKTLKVAGLPVLLALFWPRASWWHKLPEPVRHLAVATLTVSVIISLVILFNVFVLSSRYVIASGIVMLFLAAFAMSDWQQRWPKVVTTLYATLLLSLLTYSLWDKQEIDLDREAVNYIARHNTQQQPVFYDTENARFYAHLPYQGRVLGRVLFPELVRRHEVDHYAYFMITVSKDDQDVAYEQQARDVLGQHHYQLVETLYGWRKKSKALIFSRVASTATAP